MTNAEKVEEYKDEVFRLVQQLDTKEKRIQELEAQLREIAVIANNGGLRGYPNEHETLIEIRRISRKYLHIMESLETKENK